MKEIGSEVEELKRQLREAKKSERVKEQERKKNVQEEREKKREDARKIKQREKETKEQARERKKEEIREERQKRQMLLSEERNIRRGMENGVQGSVNQKDGAFLKGSMARNILQQKGEENQVIRAANKPEEEIGHDAAGDKSGEAIFAEDTGFLPLSWSAAYLPVDKIKNGIIYTTDGRYVKIIEVLPINFALRSLPEQRSILASFLGYLKIAPDKLQIKVISKKADVEEYLRGIREEIKREKDAHCRMLQEDYMRLIKNLGTKEGITRRFFLVFEYNVPGSRSPSDGEISQYLNNLAWNARKYLSSCGNQVVVPDNETRFTVEILYQLLNRKTSVLHPLSDRIQEAAEWYMRENGKESLALMPAAELFAPKELDFRHPGYVLMDGVYHAYLFIPSHKYRSRVTAGWISLLINAGEGIDVDLFAYRQDKRKSMERIGKEIRLNRSKIKDTYDTNRDYDDLSESIRSGYYLKNGLAGNEDFYYLCILVTVTAGSAKGLDWRVKELNKLLYSQDISLVSCTFQEEEAFLSALPLLALDKNIYQRAKRNVLTSGLASCYPFISYEMSDKDGILMGVNRLNSSLVIVDIFNTAIYKNANIAILGTSGAGKTFTMQLMALRMRRKNIRVFLIAPDKGHEFARAAQNIGGAYIRLSPGSPDGINIMEIRGTKSGANDLLDGRVETLSELALKIQSLHIFFSILVPDMTYEEKQLLDAALMETYKRKGIGHDNESLLDADRPGHYKKMPVLGDLYAVLLEKAETRRMANILSRLVNGSASFFNRQTSADTANKYVVLDISELSGDLTLGMFVALDYVWTEVKRDRTQEKAVFIDEVWKLLLNEKTAEYVLEIFKTIRGYGGGAVCATQDLVDFFALLGGKYGKGILSNCKMKIVLNLESREAERIREELELSEAETQAVQKFDRGSGLICANNNNMLVEFRASDLERDLITTDRKDLLRLKNRIEKYGDAAYGQRGEGGAYP